MKISDTLKSIFIFFFLVIWFSFSSGLLTIDGTINTIKKVKDDNTLNIIVSNQYDNLNLHSLTKENVKLTYMNDIDIINEVDNNKGKYDAMLISNSMWTYMLNNVSISESKSLAVSPVVFGVRMAKAKELNLIGKDITNEDILNLIKNDKISYIMPSAVRTNTGATSYLGFLNALAGNPEVLTFNHLKNQKLLSDLRDLFSKVGRNSGSDEYSFELFKTGEYDALVASEAKILEYNNTYIDDPLYLLYPTDGIAITDAMFTFIGSGEKKDLFLKVREDYLSEKAQKAFENNYYRTWYGGATNDDKPQFKKEWGIDVSKVLNVTSFPSKEIMDEAFYLYINSFRKNSAVVFVLDYSGSMEGDGYNQLQNAIEYILNPDESSKTYLQFSPDDKVSVVLFQNNDIFNTPFVSGEKSYDIYTKILSQIYASGGTPLWEATGLALDSLKDLNVNNNEYAKSIVLMTDGQSTGMNITRFINSRSDLQDIPVYPIAFGSADLSELKKIAKQSGGKFFDGRVDLIGAFREIRGYN